MAAIITRTASLYQNRESGKVEIIIVRQAGISRLDASFEVETTDLNAVDIELAQRGYTRAAAWTLSASHHGLNLSALIEPAK
jgi:hypothetical protein